MKKKSKTAHEFTVLIGFDAMRICMGMTPKTFTGNEVIRWLRLMLDVSTSK